MPTIIIPPGNSTEIEYFSKRHLRQFARQLGLETSVEIDIHAISEHLYRVLDGDNEPITKWLTFNEIMAALKESYQRKKTGGKMLTVTRREIEKHRPCGDRYINFRGQYPDLGLDESLTVAEIAANEAIRVSDLLWLLENICATDQMLRLLACDFAEHCQPDPVPAVNATAISVGRRYAFGLATDEERDATAAAAALIAGNFSAAAAADFSAAAAADFSADFSAAAAAYAAYAAYAYSAYASECAWQRQHIIAVANDPETYLENQRKKQEEPCTTTK